MYDFLYKHFNKIMYVIIVGGLFIALANFCGCSSPTETIIEYKKSIYELPYNRHYDHDAVFSSNNFIDTSGIIHSAKFYTFNFGDSIKQYPDASPIIEFNYVITVGYYDTLYFSDKLNTDDNTIFYKEINKQFNGKINVSILRYETFKPIDFMCEILYH